MYLYTVFDKSVHSWQFSEGQRLILRPFLVKIWVWSFTLNWSDVANENHFTQGIFIKISITSSENFPDGTGYWKGDKPLTVRLLFKNRRQPFGRLFCWLPWALLFFFPFKDLHVCPFVPNFTFTFASESEIWSCTILFCTVSNSMWPGPERWNMLCELKYIERKNTGKGYCLSRGLGEN